MKENYLRLQNLMEKNNVDLIVLTSPENVFYVSGVPTTFTARNRLLFSSTLRRESPITCIVPRNGEPSLIFHSAALEVIEKNSWIKNFVLYPTGTYIWREKKLDIKYNSFEDALINSINNYLDKNKIIGVEYRDISIDLFEKIRKSFNQNKIVNASNILMESRMIKNSEEIYRWKKATEILVKVMKKLEGAFKDRLTEEELDIFLKTELLKEGVDSWHQTTIAIGKDNGPDIYEQPDPRKRPEKGDIIRVDVGAIYKGYTCDLSRTYAVETVPEKAKKIYSVIKEAQRLELEAAKPNVKASEIYEKAVSYVKKNLDPEYYRGNVGHGVGVELYDEPIISASNKIHLQPNMTLSLEVPYHVKGLGGFNVEDSVLITENGNEVISNYERDEIIVI
jgi:Xaa-Pro aminopeptidase